MHCESVRVIGGHLDFSWNSELVTGSRPGAKLSSSMSCWGEDTQSTLARMNVLIAGVGTIGLDVADRLAAAGVGHLGFIDFDLIELKNLDRLREATAWDVRLFRSKIEHAARVVQRSATCAEFRVSTYEGSVADLSALPYLLDFDLIICAIDDHPWPRSVLTMLPYSDLIPVIDGGVAVDVFPDTKQMRNATWRAHVLRPGRPCMACNGQIELGSIAADREGLRRNADYIQGLPADPRVPGQNVTTIAAGAVGGYLAQFTSVIANPSGFGEPGPVRFTLSTHWLEKLDTSSRPDCVIESQLAAGDDRCSLSGSDHHAQACLDEWRHRKNTHWVKTLRWIDDQAYRVRTALNRAAERRLIQTRVAPDASKIASKTPG